MRPAHLLLAICWLCVADPAVTEDWKLLNGEHFLIFYLEDDTFAQEVLRHAERYYDNIASDLGYSRYEKFWQWEERAKIYVYQTREEFIQATGSAKWIGGFAKYDEKEIISYRWNEGFLDSLLPHELAHLIFRDFVGFRAAIPLWLDEGVAQLEEAARRKEAIGTVKKLIREGTFIPVARLMEMDVRGERDVETVRKFYAQAVTLVRYLVEAYGGSQFVQFCRELRDGKGLAEALSFAYPNSIGDVKELEEQWLKYYGGG